MSAVDPTPAALSAFLARWQNAGGSERANYQIFIGELCVLLGVEPPRPAKDDAGENAYCFERRVTFQHGDGSQSAGFIDCYRHGAFVLEAKKLKAGGTKSFDDALVRWLRPDFQAPNASDAQNVEAGASRPRHAAPSAASEGGTPPPTSAPKTERTPWPATLPEQIAAVARVLAESAAPLDTEALAARFSGKGPWKKRLPQLLDTLAVLGKAREVEDGHWMA